MTPTQFFNHLKSQCRILSTNPLVILPDGNIVSGSNDITIKIRNSTSFELISTLKGHTSYIGTAIH